MYKVQYKAKSMTESWSGVGTYGSEAQAMSSADRKKNSGAVMVRVVDSSGSTIYCS